MAKEVKQKTIGYLGPAGTFTEAAFEQYRDRHGLSDIKTESPASIIRLFELFKSGDCDAIVVPVENSVEGSVSTSMDFIVKCDHAVIEEEIILPIRHCLMASSDQPINQIETVYSHPQALAQCLHFLNKNLPQAKQIHVTSTAEAANALKERTTDAPGAIVGNKKLAALYNLSILAENINDVKTNRTRFFVLSYDKSPRTGNDKTSLIFSSKKDRPGSLVDVLNAFSVRQINLTHISSRPLKTELGDYLFFIDLEGHIEDELIQETIEDIRPKTSYLKILGSYPKGQIADD